MWKDLIAEENPQAKKAGPVIVSLDPSKGLDWSGTKYSPSKLLGYGTTFGGESGVGNPYGSSKQSQTAYDMAYFMNGKFSRKQSQHPYL
mmetsp:Transcript_69084/g.184094  ORF Transcript_69084/g.184094 Transcript_69084/m.184094 type:complete len:89 (+) Transcript_69084:82-348(+)